MFEGFLMEVRFESEGEAQGNLEQLFLIDSAGQGVGDVAPSKQLLQG